MHPTATCQPYASGRGLQLGRAARRSRAHRARLHAAAPKVEAPDAVDAAQPSTSGRGDFFTPGQEAESRQRLFDNIAPVCGHLGCCRGRRRAPVQQAWPRRAGLKNQLPPPKRRCTMS